MILYVIVGKNRLLNNISARAVYSKREYAENHLKDPNCMWFDDEAVIVELELDKKTSSYGVERKGGLNE